MIRSGFILILMFFAQIAQAQNIENFFLLVPDNKVDDLTVSERKELIKEGTLHKNDDTQYGISIDRTNGYLHLSQSYTDGKVGFQKIDMCYWNCDNGEKLIGISTQGGNHSEIFQNDLMFFKYKNNELEPVYYGVFKEYSVNTDAMLFSIINHIVNDKATQQDKEDIRYGLLFQLPQKGKNIKLYYRGSVVPDSEDQIDPLTEKMNSTSKTYIWQGNGIFK